MQEDERPLFADREDENDDDVEIEPDDFSEGDDKDLEDGPRVLRREAEQAYWEDFKDRLQKSLKRMDRVKRLAEINDRRIFAAQTVPALPRYKVPAAKKKSLVKELVKILISI